MTTCRGCGSLFTEGHNEDLCVLAAQMAEERTSALQRESVLIEENEQLKTENAQIAAQNKLLMESLTFARKKLYILVETQGAVSPQVLSDAQNAYKTVVSALETPLKLPQSLVHVEASAGKAGFLAAMNLVRLRPERANHAVFVLDEAEKFADSLRAKHTS